MSTEPPTERILDAPYQNFVESILPLYSGPYVKIRIGTANWEYKLSRAILCKQSPYFAATFEGSFQEGCDQSTTLTEMDGIVSPRSFGMLVQWLYLGRVIFDESSPKETISAIIEFVRLADMCGVTGMETPMAERIKAIMLANPALENSKFDQGRDPDTNTYSLTPQHVISTALLPNGHPVRKVLASAAVEGYIRRDHHKFLKEIRDAPNFAADLLMEVKETLKTVAYGEPKITFRDPFTGRTLPFVTRSG